MQESYFEYDVQERYATLSKVGRYHKEFNRVSFCGGKPVYDVRIWIRSGKAEIPCKGATLTKEEAIRLRDALNSLKELDA